MAKDSTAPPNPEKVFNEARSRIMWGESQDEVREWLIEQGQDTMGIDQILRTCMAERGALVRKRGLVEIMVALGLILAGTSVILFLWFVVGIMISGVFAVCIAVAAYGLFRLLRGLGWLSSGAGIHGSVADLEGWF